MICAEDEIGIGESHDGIMVLPSDIPAGTPAAKYFNVKSDYCLEVELTPNRVDAASHYGVARDLKAPLHPQCRRERPGIGHAGNQHAPLLSLSLPTVPTEQWK